MSAFRRRTVFAAPLIVSLAVAAPGCGKGEPEGTRNPPEPTPRATPPEGSQSAPALAQWDVRRVDTGACQAESVVECDPGTKCNPPPPRAIECPAGTSGRTVIRVAAVGPDRCAIVPKGCADVSCMKLVTACPLPHGKKLPEKLVEVWIVEKNKTGDMAGCHAEEPSTDCPPNVDCNPPVPRKIACPPGVTDTVEVKVGLLPDKTCAVLPDGCNAPGCATTKTPCPPN